MAGSRFGLASIWTAFLTFVLLSQCVDAVAMHKRAEAADLGPLAPETPEVMAVTHKANSKMQLNMAPDVAMQQIHAKYTANVEKNMASGCTTENIAVRKEW